MLLTMCIKLAYNGFNDSCFRRHMSSPHRHVGDFSWCFFVAIAIFLKKRRPSVKSLKALKLRSYVCSVLIFLFSPFFILFTFFFFLISQLYGFKLSFILFYMFYIFRKGSSNSFSLIYAYT